MDAPILKIEGARYVVTMDRDRRIIRDGSVVVQGGAITHVGKRTELSGVATERTIDARRMVVTPGFVNGHVHISYPHAVRGLFPDDMDPREYLRQVFALQSAMTAEEEYLTSLLAITELLKSGTTCLLDPGSTSDLDACMRAYEESGCRIVVGRQVTDQPNPMGLPVYSTAEATTAMEQAIASYDGALEGRVRAWAMPFSSDYASTELLQAAKGLADGRGAGLTLHATNSASSVRRHVEKHGRRPVEYLEHIGALAGNVLLSHAVGLDDGEVACIARTGTRVVMLPGAAMKMGLGFSARAKLPELLARGVSVGLGTDSANNSNLLDTMRAMYLAAVLFKDGRQSTAVVRAEQALEMATIEGARALGLDAQVGSVEVGKRADLVLFDADRAEWAALMDPVNNLVYSADGRSVHTVIVDGRVVVEKGVPLFVDEADLVRQVQGAGEGLLARAGVSFTRRWPVV